MVQTASVHDIERERQMRGNVRDPHHRKKNTPERRPAGRAGRTVDQRVVIAIDVQNLYYGAKDLYGTKVAYQRFLEKVLNGRKMVRSIAYIANRDGNNQGSFIKLMRGIGCDIRCKQVIERPNGMKCNWDVEIAVDALAIAPRIDTFILASGDGDFTYLLRALRMQGVKTEVVAFRPNTAHALIEEADEYRDIGKDMLIENSKAWRHRDDRPTAKPADRNDGGDDGHDDDDGHEGDDYYEEPDYDDE